ncbi:MAG: flagellar biosynthetic protein FliR [Deltaproteobacteria bacterium]|nr:flagellar biosynthetic protein FliR [Deltaproteobacteria bacterium]
MTMPFFSEVKLSRVTQLLLPIAISFLIAPIVAKDVMPVMSQSPLVVGLAITGEILIGVFIGFALNIVFVLASIVGETAGQQAGFSLASIFDPSLGQVSLISFLLRNTFFYIFFVFNLHHVLIYMMVQSYEFFPVGGSFLSFSSAAPAMVTLFSQIYMMAMRIVLPVIVVILLSHITMGIISITAPQMNIYFNAAITLNIIIGMYILAESTPVLVRFFRIGFGLFENFVAGFVLSGA